MIKAYIFDLFGTLVSHDFKKIEGYHEALLVDKNTISVLPEKLRKRYIEISNNDKITLYEDSEEVIKKLKAKFKIALISNIYDLTRKRVEELFEDFLKNFDVVVFSSEIGLAKPDHKIFQYAFKQLGVKPEEAVMVGDSTIKDIEPAKELGMSTILIDRDKQTLGGLMFKELKWKQTKDL